VFLEDTTFADWAMFMNFIPCPTSVMDPLAPLPNIV
jgi:hypothetical protein